MTFLNPTVGEGRKPRTVAGAPTNGTDAVQTITIGGTPTGGTFRLLFKGQRTTAIAWTATDATLVADIDAALGALTTVGGASNVTAAAGTVSSGIGTITVTFVAANGKSVQPLMTYESSLTGTAPTLAIATTTPGVTATHRGAPIGAKLVRTSNGVEYRNTGTPTAPTWTQQTTPSAEMAALEAAIPVAAVADVAAANGTTVAAANASAVAGTATTPANVVYTQGDITAMADTLLEAKATINALVTLANANKVQVNVLITEATELKSKLNLALAGLRTAGIVTP